jgi:hypothetical protein
LLISLLFVNCYQVTILCFTLKRVLFLFVFRKSLKFHKLNPFVYFHHNTHPNSVHVTYGHDSQENNFNYSLPLTSNLASTTYKENLPFGSFLLPKLQRKFPHGLLLFPEAAEAHQALLCSGHIIELNSLHVPLRNLFPSFNYLLIVFLRYDLPPGCVIDGEKGERGRG